VTKSAAVQFAKLITDFWQAPRQQFTTASQQEKLFCRSLFFGFF
jgi:hypothetical protein